MSLFPAKRINKYSCVSSPIILLLLSDAFHTLLAFVVARCQLQCCVCCYLSGTIVAQAIKSYQSQLIMLLNQNYSVCVCVFLMCIYIVVVAAVAAVVAVVAAVAAVAAPVVSL